MATKSKRPQKARSPSRAKAHRQGADHEAARELVLYIENESDLSPDGPRGQGHDVLLNALRKWRSGTYDPKLAVKLFGYLAESGAKKYAREFGNSQEWATMFNPATREEAARQLEESFRSAANHGEYDHVDTGRGSGARPRSVADRTPKMDAFTRQYFETALWSSTDESTDSGGDPLDENYSISDIDPKTRDRMIEDCAEFQKDFGDLIDDDTGDYERAGHDFWLTRNGHGAGFWDGDWPKHGDELTDASKDFGEFNLYVGGDGVIYGDTSGGYRYNPGYDPKTRKASPREVRARRSAGHRIEIRRGRLGWSAVLLDRSGRSINVINGAPEDSKEDVERSAKHHWPNVPITAAHEGRVAAHTSTFKKGDRVMWSDAFLQRGKTIDPKWFTQRKNERGTVDWIQRDGDVIVEWDGDPITTVHPPDRLAHATDRMLEERRVAARRPGGTRGGPPRRYYIVEQDQHGQWMQVGHFHARADAERFRRQVPGRSRIIHSFPSGHDHPVRR